MAEGSDARELGENDHRRWRSPLRWLAFVPALLFLGGLATRPALANPIVVAPEASIAALAIVNLPLDLALLALGVLLVARVYGWKVCNLPRDYATLVWRILFASGVVAFVGAVIDLLLVFPEDLSGNPLEIHPLRWPLACLMIFGSVILAYLLIVRINRKAVLLPSVILALVSPVSWYVTARFQIASHETPAWGPVCWTTWILGLAVTATAMIYLARLHRQACPSV